jgi:hypothetical protein
MNCILCTSNAVGVLIPRDGRKAKYPICKRCAKYKKYDSDLYDLIEEELKTSAEWQKLCKIKVISPKGWVDGFGGEGWNKDKITRSEFERRVVLSDIDFSATPKVLSNIWKDIDKDIDSFRGID